VSILTVSGVTKAYGALRPLRIDRLEVEEGQQVALIGLDQPAAEVFISLVTGTSLPDTGTITAFGRPTGEITDSTDWLATLDRFGIVSERAALLDSLSVVQNLAVPFSLAIEPPSPEVRERAVALASESAIAEDWWDRPVRDLDRRTRLRVRLARALALMPSMLLIEHPSAALEPGEIAATGRDIRRIAEARGTSAVTLTMDETYAASAASLVLTLDPATGRLSERRTGRFRFWS
jgi:iron(III) transport system ATP-binding protein